MTSSSSPARGLLQAIVRRQLQPLAARDEPSEAQLLLTSFERSSEGWFWATDNEGLLTYLTGSVVRMLGLEADEVVGSGFSHLFRQADDLFGIREALPFIMSRRSDFERLSLQIAGSDNECCWAVSGFAQFDSHGSFQGYRGYGVNSTEQRRTSQDASRLAMYDSLTGLPNRLSKSRFLEATLAKLDPQDGSCAVMLLDLDRFKQVNDTLGHPAGDALLKQVAERLLLIIGDRERVCRLGGDEFQIILPSFEDRAALGQLASQLINDLSQPYVVHGSRCVIGASVGVAVAPFDGSTSDDLIRNADLALYAAKESGRGRFRLFSDNLLKAAEERRDLENDLRDALGNGELRLAYQPVVSAADDRIKGVEALIRWDHPERGPISPAVFIPIAEDANLVERLGEWVLRQACEDAVKWPVKLRVAVNVSPIQFSNENFPATVVSALAQSGLTPDRLELEITEGVFLNESAETDTMFARLKEIGVRLALDDFGTGYSSLGYLRTAPFDKIKIDQSFVRGATIKGSRNGAIMAAIVALAEALGMETTAEGIETHDQLELIKRLRVSHIQGYIYSKPISCSELTTRLDAGAWAITPSGPAKQRSDRVTMYRKAAAIYGNQYCSILIRNLSDSGALVEGLQSASVGTRVLIDLGSGQICMATVRRVVRQQRGIEFGQALVSDGNGGLCSRHRVSAHSMESVGLPIFEEGEEARSGERVGNFSVEQLVETLGLDRTHRMPRLSVPGTASNGADSEVGEARTTVPTVADLATRLGAHLQKTGRSQNIYRQCLQDHILPAFGDHAIDSLSMDEVTAWLAAKTTAEGCSNRTARRLSAVLSYMSKLAHRWDVPGVEDPHAIREHAQGAKVDRPRPLTQVDIDRLNGAVMSSANSQLRYVIPLLIATGVDVRELLAARWPDVDIVNRKWRIPLSIPGTMRQIGLSDAAITVLGELPRFERCPYLVVNPRTMKPYQSLTRGWDAVRRRAELPHLSLHDLRYLGPA